MAYETNYTKSTTNSQGKKAPEGYHYMPDGKLMSDAEHAIKFGADKTINVFDFDTSDINQAGETRQFTLSATPGAKFSMFIKNEDNYYYNFRKGSFQAAETRLNNITIEGGRYQGNVIFPAVSDADQYDVFLFAEVGTKHANYNEVRFDDGTLDINSSTGSNSLLVQKVIYQKLNTTLTIATIAPTAAFSWTEFTLISSYVGTTQAITTQFDKVTGKIPFSVTATAASTKAFKLNTTPSQNAVNAYVARTIGVGEKIDGENNHPTVTNTDTVNGAVTSGNRVVMDSAVATKMTVGDRITGNAALDATTVRVVSLNPDGDNVNEFQMTSAVAIADGATLSFSNHKHYSFTIDNVDGLDEGMIAMAANTLPDTTISNYKDVEVINQGTEKEKVKLKYEKKGIFSKVKPTITRNASTKLVTTTQSGSVTFNKQQLLVLEGDAVNIYAYGRSQIKTLTGWDLIFTDMKAELTTKTTTTTSAVNSSTTVPIADGRGIMEDVSTVSGIGIDPSAANPVVSTINSFSGGTASLELSAAQTLESGTTLTFEGAGAQVTITGNVQIIKTGSAALTVSFDLEKFLLITEEAS